MSEKRLNFDCGLLQIPCDPKECGIDALAFIGDSVFSLFAREYLICKSFAHADVLHERAVAMVRCEAQAEYMKRILPHLTEEENGIFRRGRNYHTSHTPRKSVAAYHAATGLEALFGYLYLAGRLQRLRELFGYCFDDIQGN